MWSIWADRKAGRMRARSRIVAGLLAAALSAPAAMAPASAAADPMTTWQTVVVGLPNGAIAPDPARGTLLVGVADSVPVLGNHLVELDPETGELGRSVFVGSQPSEIAVADNGSRA